MRGPVWERMTPAKITQNWASAAPGLSLHTKTSTVDRDLKGQREDEGKRETGEREGGDILFRQLRECEIEWWKKNETDVQCDFITVTSLAINSPSSLMLPPPLFLICAPQNSGTHPLPSLCQGVVSVFISPMDHNSDLKRRLQGSSLSQILISSHRFLKGEIEALWWDPHTVFFF